MSQGKKPIILLIEADASLRRLIVLGLQQRSMHVIEASSPARIPSFDIQQVDLLVLDLDGSAHRKHASLSSIHTPLAHSLLSTLPTVLLAWEYPPSINATQNRTTATYTSVQYLTKPFDARALHETIDTLLLVQRAEEVTIEARAEELLLATYSKHTSPSIWPIITAAGLFLAFIGMMLQIAMTVVGILVVIIALLLWALENRPEADKLALSIR